MTTTDYLPIQPIGLGTIEVEAFGSVLCRMAQAHSVSVYTLAMHLRHWWKRSHLGDDRAKLNIVNGINPMLCGYGPNIDAYLDIVKEATGCEAIERTTFLALKGALDPNGHGVIRPDRAWCPACLEEAHLSGEQFYDRLAWATKAIRRCPIHKLSLSTKCPSCHATQLHYHHLGAMDLCFKCKSPLRTVAEAWVVIPEPQLYERECLDLVGKISAGELRIAPNAYSVFITTFAEYLSPLGKKISRFAYKAPRRPQLAREGRPPRLDTLLRRCAAFGVSPADVLSDPEGTAKSACLLEFARLDLPATAKPRRAAELVELARRRLESELDEARIDAIPSLRQIARDVGVSTGFLNFHFPDLIPKYSVLRKTNSKRSIQRSRDSALAFLLAGPVFEYPSPEFSSQDRLVEATVERTGIGVRAARLAVKAALKQRFGAKSYEKYRKRRRRDPTAKWPPCD
ncbi:TniQ family protein [Dyella japonica]|uniref:TniQ family protein n=1 Tax=Dyella japonica TaxID=231455 RepID=UPI0003064968